MSIFKLAIWDLSGRVTNYFVVFIVGVILTRLLSPEEFGAFGIVLSIISLSAVFVDFGFRAAVIQSQDTTQEQLSTVFYINLFISLALIFIFSVSAKFIEGFYQIVSLSNYIILASSIFAFNALALVPSGLLQKNLELKTISLINTAAAFLSGVIAISLAYFGFKVWALIIQQVALAFFALIGFTYFAGWLPTLTFNLSSIKKMWQYGSKLLLSGFLESIFSRIDVFIIGKIFSLETLGYYNRAQSLDGLVRNLSSSTIISIAFPLIARMSTEKEKTQRLFLRSLHGISFISFLLIGVLFLTSTDIVVILFSARWEVVGSYFRIMTITGFAYPISALMVTVLSARGNSKAFLRLEIIKKSIAIPIYFSFFVGGIYFFLIALGISYLMGLVANAIYVRKEIFVSLKQQFLVIFKYGFISNLGIALVFGTTYFINNIYLHFIVSSVLFSMFYLLLGYKLKLEGFLEMSQRIENFYNDKRNSTVSSAD